jgi:hypothetical protein
LEKEESRCSAHSSKSRNRSGSDRSRGKSGRRKSWWGQSIVVVQRVGIRGRITRKETRARKSGQNRRLSREGRQLKTLRTKCRRRRKSSGDGGKRLNPRPSRPSSMRSALASAAPGC